MADLQSCFFCGSPDQLKQYAVVPSRHTDDGNPQTAVLCPQCKTKLLQVVEPLVDRLEGDAATPTSGQKQPPQPADDTGVTVTESDGQETGADPDGAAAEAVSGGADAPPNYRRAMRMLETREFPLDRAEVESLLANAYDLETHELEAVFAHAVETGDLVEEDGQFHKPGR